MQVKPLRPEPYRFLDSIFYSDIIKFDKHSIFTIAAHGNTGAGRQFMEIFEK
ncbi:MAG: hypothetical protein ACUZ8N_13985 [Candidatus Scalindua sp.]